MTYDIIPQSNTYIVKLLPFPHGMSSNPSYIKYGEVVRVSSADTKVYNKGDKIIFDEVSSIFIRTEDQGIHLVEEKSILAKIEKTP